MSETKYVAYRVICSDRQNRRHNALYHSKEVCVAEAKRIDGEEGWLIENLDAARLEIALRSGADFEDEPESVTPAPDAMQATDAELEKEVRKIVDKHVTLDFEDYPKGCSPYSIAKDVTAFILSREHPAPDVTGLRDLAFTKELERLEAFACRCKPGSKLCDAHEYATLVRSTRHATPAPDATGLRDSDSLLASATDLLNSWARESSVREAETPEDIVGVIDRLWSAISVRLHATPAQPSRAQMDLQSTDAYEVGFSNGQAAMTKKSRAQIDAAMLAQVFTEMSDGIAWKEPEADGHFDRAAKKLAKLAAHPTPEQEGKR